MTANINTDTFRKTADIWGGNYHWYCYQWSTVPLAILVTAYL